MADKIVACLRKWSWVYAPSLIWPGKTVFETRNPRGLRKPDSHTISVLKKFISVNCRQKVTTVFYPPSKIGSNYGKNRTYWKSFSRKEAKMKITQEEVTHVANSSKLEFLSRRDGYWVCDNLVQNCRHGGRAGRSGQPVWPQQRLWLECKTVLRPDVAERDRPWPLV